MREIKFREWRPINGDPGLGWKMDYDPEAKSYEPVSINEELQPYDEGYVFMQFTGLLDKNGNEVYEGDILLVPDVYTDIIVDGQGTHEEDNHLAPVVFKDGSFGCDIQDNGDYFKKGFVSFPMMEYEMASLSNNELEIIGNIYENPKLLEAT